MNRKKGFLDAKWKNYHLVSFETPGDGSCLLHSFLAAFSKEYHTSKDKTFLIREVRKELSSYLDLEYDNLYEGNLKTFSSNVEEFSKENMKKTLENYNAFLGHGYFELISKAFEKNIFLFNTKPDLIINYETKFYSSLANFPSILILYLNNHFEMIGVQKEDKIRTIFSPDDEIIKEIRKLIDKEILRVKNIEKEYYFKF